MATPLLSHVISGFGLPVAAQSNVTEAPGKYKKFTMLFIINVVFVSKVKASQSCEFMEWNCGICVPRNTYYEVEMSFKSNINSYFF